MCVFMPHTMPRSKLLCSPTLLHHHSKRYEINCHPSLFTRCSMGRLTTVMFIQRIDRCNALRNLGKEKQRKACLSTSHFPPENINPRENHFQFTSHDCKYFLNFCLECSPLEQTCSPQRMWSLSPPKLGGVMRRWPPGYLAWFFNMITASKLSLSEF